MSMRPPQAALDRLSSLSSLGDSAPDRRPPGQLCQASDAGETTGLVQRCVIIQRDQHGFGFTVSGDRIVLVQSVRPGGAAMRAGVQEGDRIVKVNGTMVTNSSHLEVVKLIKSGAYVALTLLGSPPASVGLSSSQQDGHQTGAPQGAPTGPPPPPPLPPQQHITDPKPLQDPEVQKHATQILWNMLRHEEAELQRCYEVYHRNPVTPVEEQIEGARRRVSQLQHKIRQETGGARDPSRLLSDSSPATPRVSDGRRSLDSQDGDSGLDSGPERFPSASEISLNWNSVLADPCLDSPHTSPGVTPRATGQHHRRLGSDSPFPSAGEQGVDQTSRLEIIGPEEDCDPGYFNNECDSLFQDLGKLKMRPAHLGVFLRYIFSQADPSPLLLYLCADVCQTLGPKDARGLARDLWHLFLEKTAPLRVKIPDHLLAEIDSRLRSGEDVRSALLEARDAVLPEIQEQIQDYRTKRTMGLGSLYGENDLMDLDGDPQKERQVAEKQLAQLGELLSPMSFALNTYMSHTGMRPLEPRPASVVEKAQERDKWLPFFPKAKKQSSGTKKDKEALEDKKRNPILKYIAKPKSSSQSTFHVPLSPVEVKPGSVRNIIQHFENSQHHEGPEPGSSQRLSTGSFPEDLLEVDSSRSEVRLGRSESLKGREELGRLRRADNVPRSRSDVDMDAAAEATRLHQSASSSASSLSTRSLENPTPPYTPKMGRRSIESPNLGFGPDAFLPHLLEDDPLGPLSDLELEPDSQNWQHTVGRDLVAQLSQREVDRQEVINELLVTEASHLRTLRVLDVLFYQRLRKESLLSREELALLFPNLPELIEVHNSLSESMKRLREEGPVVKEIGDLMLARFDGWAREELQRVAAKFCASQAAALELIKAKQRKETRFQLFMQEAESSPQCRRLQLKDLIVSEMQRLTKYPLLLENILRHTHGGTAEHQKLSRARDQCREILRYVNEAVKRAENQHRLEAYQKRLDATSLERTSNPLAAEFKSLDLRSRRMIHEGPLSWRISKDKTVDLHVLLLEDLLVLLQRQDERLVLKCHSKTALGASDTKQTFSPVLKLSSVLVRSVATDKRALFIICTSELGPQIYELVALTSSEKKTLDAEVSPSLPEGSTASRQEEEEDEEDEEEGATDAAPAEVPVEEMLPEALGEEEEEEEERPGSGRRLQLFQEPGCAERLAESALEDVDTLRRLLLRSFLPCRDPDPEEEDPTPALCGVAEASRDADAEEGGSSSSSPWQAPRLPTCLEGGRSTEGVGPGQHGRPEEPPVGWPPPLEAEAPPAAEGHGSYQVVRKGNCFYVSLPPAGSEESHTEARRSPSPAEAVAAAAAAPQSPPKSPPAPRALCGSQWRAKAVPPALPAPGQGPRDVELLFQTIEQLTLKLTRLKDVEAAHHDLLRSLGGGSSTDATPVETAPLELSPWLPDSHPQPEAGQAPWPSPAAAAAAAAEPGQRGQE
ncbi:hypothetical protein lerEdw1_011536 [Lerista edwardsae]|nr:hypothetical protein lerEdw1_011536 [Lerista edwardsae]